MTPPGYLSLLRENTDFRRLWLGVVVSFFGDWFATIALYTMAQELTDSARAISLVLIAKTLPIFLVVPVAGPLVDRLDRRRILIATDLIRAGLTLGLLVGYGLQSLPMILGVEVLRAGVAGVFIPCRTAVIPQVTNPGELPVAMALNGGTWSVMLALGAAAGGLVTAGLGVSGALLIDAFTFLISAYLLWPLPALPPRPDHEDPGETSFLDGLRSLRGQVYLPALLLVKLSMSLNSAAMVTLPIFGNGVFVAAGPAWIGLLYMSRGLGAAVGSVGIRRVTGDDSRVLRWAISPGLLWMGASLVVLASAPSIGWAGLAFFSAAIGNGVGWVFSSILAQRTVPQAYRGRLFSLEFGLMTLGSAGWSWLAGYAIDVLGWSVQEVVWTCGALLMVPAVVWVVVLICAPDIHEIPAANSPPR